MNNIKNVVIVALVVITVILLSVNGCTRQKLMEGVINEAALSDSLHSHRNKEGEYVSRIKAFQADKVSDILAINTKDSVILQLKSDLARNKKYLTQGGSVAVIGTQTNAHIADTITSRGKDTLVVGDTVYVYPEYSFGIHQFGEWITGTGKVNKDSVNIDIQLKHEYSIVIGTESNGLFKKRTPFAELTNKNPYDSTTALRVANITAPKDHVKLKVGIGIALGLIGGYIIWH